MEIQQQQKTLVIQISKNFQIFFEWFFLFFYLLNLSLIITDIYVYNNAFDFLFSCVRTFTRFLKNQEKDAARNNI